MMVIIFCVTAITIATLILNTAKMRVFGTYATVSNCFSMDIAEFDLDESILSFSTSAIHYMFLLQFHFIFRTPRIEYDFLVIFMYISTLSDFPS